MFPNIDICPGCTRIAALSARGLCGICERSAACGACGEHFDAARGPCPCEAERPEVDAETKEIAAVVLATEAETRRATTESDLYQHAPGTPWCACDVCRGEAAA